MKVYTKTGDKGKTSLIGGERVMKNHVRLNAYGTIDELNSFLGLLRSKTINEKLHQQILHIQNNLFTIGAHLASNQNTSDLPKYAILSNIEIENLEKSIDLLEEKLPKLTNFIIYGENETSAICHVCRAIARRAEREILTASQEVSIGENILIYINRLSDFLFILGRSFSENAKKNNFFWQK